MTGRAKHEELPWYKWVYEVVRAAIEEFGADQAGRMGAALAFYTLFALVPLLFIASAVAGFILGDGSLERVVMELERIAGETIANQVGGLLQSVVESSGASLLIGLPLAAFTGSAIVLQVQRVLNEIFHAPEPESGGIMRIIRQRLFGVVAAFALALLVLTPIVAVAAVDFLAGLLPEDLGWLASLLRLGVPLVSLGMLVVVVGVTFQLFTRHEIPWPAARRGGFFTALIVLAAAFAVGTYLSFQGTGGGTGVNALAVIGGVAILLFFFNLMWQVYLFGAEVTKVYADYLEHGDIVKPSERTERIEKGTRPKAERQVVTEAGGGGEAVATAGLLGLLLGLALGWWRRPR